MATSSGKRNGRPKEPLPADLAAVQADVQRITAMLVDSAYKLGDVAEVAVAETADLRKAAATGIAAGFKLTRALKDMFDSRVFDFTLMTNLINEAVDDLARADALLNKQQRADEQAIIDNLNKTLENDGDN